MSDAPSGLDKKNPSLLSQGVALGFEPSPLRGKCRLGFKGSARWILFLILVCCASAVVAEPIPRELRPDSEEIWPLPRLEANSRYSLLVSVPEFASLGESERIVVRVEDAQGTVTTKILHAGDPDLYLTLRPRIAGDGQVVARLSGGMKTLRIELSHSLMEGRNLGSISALPNGDWQSAQPIELDQTIYGSGDERPYVPVIGTASEQLESLYAGAQWFTFEYAGPESKLAYFDLEIPDRDVPADVAIFTIVEKDGVAAPVLYSEGAERYMQEKSMAIQCLNKFIERIHKPGR